jgi:membrane-anchored protein YejM (alkaline phosphatase superfamily)
MSPELYWPVGVLLVLICLVFVGFASERSNNGLDFMFAAQLLGILAVPLLLVIPGWVTLRTGLWMCNGVALLLVLLMVGADMNRPSGSALSTGVQILFLPFAALFLLLYRFSAWLFSKRESLRKRRRD